MFFQADATKTNYMAKVIPYRGSWVEFETDAKNILYVRIDRKRKFPATVFLRALGIEDDSDILRTFYHPLEMRASGGKYEFKVSSGLLGRKLRATVSHRGKELVKRGRRIREEHIEALRKAKIEWVGVSPSEVAGAFSVGDVVDETTGEVLVEATQPLTVDRLAELGEVGISEFEVIFPEREEVGSTLIETLGKDTVRTQNDALLEIYRRLRPGDPPTIESSRNLFKSMFFDPTRYDFSRVGRLKFNTKLYGVSEDQWPEDIRERWIKGQDQTPSCDDFVAVLGYMLRLRRGIGSLDDIDHLGNRRVRSVGELCWRTSSGSGWCGWSGPSRRRCPSTRR